MKKIKVNGKTYHKFDIAYLIDQIAPFSNATIIYDICSYKFLCEMLYDKICQKGRKDILERIEWNDNIPPF